MIVAGSLYKGMSAAMLIAIPKFCLRYTSRLNKVVSDLGTELKLICAQEIMMSWFGIRWGWIPVFRVSSDCELVIENLAGSPGNNLLCHQRRSRSFHSFLHSRD